MNYRERNTCSIKSGRNGTTNLIITGGIVSAYRVSVNVEFVQNLPFGG